MAWRVMVDSGQTGWDRRNWILQLDATENWTEAWDGIVTGYQQRRYASDAEAAAIARSLRALGYSASTENVSDEA